MDRILRSYNSEWLSLTPNRLPQKSRSDNRTSCFASSRMLEYTQPVRLYYYFFLYTYFQFLYYFLHFYDRLVFIL